MRAFVKGCNSKDEERIAKALEQTLQAREKGEASEEIGDEVSEPEEAIPTDTATPTKTATQTPTNTPTNTPTEVPTPKGEVTTAHSMFKGPQVDHPFIKKTTLGEEVWILGRTDDGVWYKIMDSEGTMGWCYSEFIKLITDVRVPIIYDIPTPVPTICTCDVYTPCDCDGYSAPPPCDCDTHSTNVCTCDQVCTCDTVHYWYPD